MRAVDKARGASERDIASRFVVGAILAPIIFVGLMLYLVDRQNAIANSERHRQAAGVVEFFVSQRLHVAEDNSQWDEFYRRMEGAPDIAWFQENIGVEQYGIMQHDSAAVLEADGRVVAGSSEGEAVAAEHVSELGPGLAALLADVVATGTVWGSFLPLDGQVAYVTVSPICAHSVEDRCTGRYLLLVEHFDAEPLEVVRETLGWTDLRVAADGPEATRHPIVGPEGEPLAFLVWDRPTPGYSALGTALPVILISVAVLAVSVIGLLGRVRQAAARLVAAEQEARELAHRDALTGIANRRALDAAAARLVAEPGPLHSVVIDFDGFKEVNDRLGHRIGDALLVEMTRRMTAILPEHALLARIGGDEFALLLRDETASVRELATDIVHEISRPFSLPGQTISISASAGVAPAEPGITAEELIRRADVAMYDAKTHRSGRVHVYHDRLDQHRRLALRLDADMRAGLEAGQFWVAYQPIYSLAEDRVVAVEALLRWDHPELGQVAPGIFIPVAERSRFIIHLGDFVLREACRRVAEVPELQLSVNLSPVQLLDETLVARVQRTLVESGLEGGRLELEVTEGYLIEQQERAIGMLGRLRALGVRISLDDFGTGYASLGYLRRFPLDKIKIDRSFVSGIEEDGQGRRVLAAVVALCHAFGVPITAEGVETERQAEFLRRTGCDRVQGFLVGRPIATLPEDDRGRDHALL